ncbi:DUF1801 domain-containing protein [Sulfitobacter pseudonitzschiae]|uniref:DUF1801 domain-containing protein n=1 Tax=Pseudosulfitobacter pseudonitzschiae TaxID=1402135 RepID=A0A9Q2NFP0_9RHOB|nr:hypothetical protein [Pseudosulfitobacter pseudonitzschiae]MBM2291242.1 DUF1801 domain-containing protein [Pseudosulfitobacter pseudonitzschiae]MBM2296160.1 DUF1801 domain-containing protein [Pseudosulfitobacter pseudonitzschiae]MBM2301073.1 DUF1801 domain-containing protein [Pseudosulfitobacter pseudonitzschiae]MBM2310857.1 DUF1801 domain-containing protein [Pseudosulfitobacter pseudonitzschiae]MBM2315770.1 DUF1801 domain-containing protein [Pseudosulfitobacter pseudonitzschiae]
MDPFNQTTARWPAAARARFDSLRAAILSAAHDASVGPVTESLKWGQPAWRPATPRSGSTLRLNWSPEVPEVLTLYVDCKTDLAQRMVSLYPDLPNDGRRALALPLEGPAVTEAVAHLAAMTFTYHRKA